ncbi:GspE/PulE family protein [Syntrophomonas erecta]
MVHKRKMMGEFLIEVGLITSQQLQEALREQEHSGKRLGQILVSQGVITEQQLIETLEFMLGIPHVRISKINIDPEVVKLVPAQLLRHHKVLPISRRKDSLTLAMADPFNQQGIDDIRMATGLDIVPLLASEREIDIALRQLLAFRIDSNMERILGELNQTDKAAALVHSDSSLRVGDDAPIIRVVNSILIQAVHGHCSDVHIEPQEGEGRIRFRIDGELFHVLNLPAQSMAALVSRVKIMASMDIAEKRVPQDGRFRMHIEDREVDFRVSTLPTQHGEKVVLRILDRVNAFNRFDQLGLSPQNKEKLMTLAYRPYGMVLVTGPTGSGKTTTMYSILNEINSMDKNIITLEDPVEYSLAGVNQVQTNIKAGLTFSSGLRSVLRQDPDVIMVGEIRDEDTARLAVQAALTGHLLLSTLHTNSAAGTIARLTDMGIEDFLLNSALAGVVSQRLVRMLCPNCRETYFLDEATARRLGISQEAHQQFYRATGCNMCRQLGYQGRIALHEILIPGSQLRSLIGQGENAEDIIEQVAQQEGMTTIQADGIAKAKQGLTSLEEVMKVVWLGGV